MEDQDEIYFVAFVVAATARLSVWGHKREEMPDAHAHAEATNRGYLRPAGHALTVTIWVNRGNRS